MSRGGPRITTADGKKNGVGERVRERRLELRMTQDRLSANLARLTEGQWNPSIDEIHNLEVGRRLCGDLELRVLARALETNVLWLMGEE